MAALFGIEATEGRGALHARKINQLKMLVSAWDISSAAPFVNCEVICFA